MITTGLLRNVSYIDVALLVLIIFFLIRGIVTQGKIKKEIQEEMEEKVEALKKYQGMPLKC
jgi:biopolymer transport protein ExbD